MRQNELLGLALSVVTVALFIIALILFISYGGSAAFYAAAAAALVVGVLNAWMISAAGRRAANAPAPHARRVSRRKRSRR